MKSLFLCVVILVFSASSRTSYSEDSIIINDGQVQESEQVVPQVQHTTEGTPATPVWEEAATATTNSTSTVGVDGLGIEWTAGSESHTEFPELVQAAAAELPYDEEQVYEDPSRGGGRQQSWWPRKGKKKVIDSRGEKWFKRETYNNAKGNTMSWKKYHRYAVIANWLVHMTNNSPFATLIHIGVTHEGRHMSVFKLDSSPKTPKPKIFIEGGMHAKEWVSPATVTYIMKQLTMNYKKYKEVVDLFEWYFLPVANPDGYEYTFNEERMWLKTRTNLHKNTTECFGVDPNRNFPVGWQACKGSQKYCACSDHYPGQAPGSEPCVRHIMAFLNTVNEDGKLAAYFSLHANGQQWMTPYSRKKDQLPANHQTLVDVATVGANAIRKVRGTKYQVGTAASFKGVIKGTSTDWAFEALKVPFVFTLNLPPPDGRPRFFVPVSQIASVGGETFAGIKAAAVEIHARLNKGYQAAHLGPSAPNNHQQQQPQPENFAGYTGKNKKHKRKWNIQRPWKPGSHRRNKATTTARSTSLPTNKLHIGGNAGDNSGGTTTSHKPIGGAFAAWTATTTAPAMAPLVIAVTELGTSGNKQTNILNPAWYGNSVNLPGGRSISSHNIAVEGYNTGQLQTASPVPPGFDSIDINGPLVVQQEKTLKVENHDAI